MTFALPRELCQNKQMRRSLGFALVCLGLLPGIPPAHAAPVVLDRLEASVNSSLILLSDVSRFRKTEKLRSQIDPLFAGTVVATQGDKATQQEIVQFLVDEDLIIQQFPITDQEVEQEINQIQNNNHLERSQLRQFLRQQGFTFDDYFELIRASASKRNLIDRDIRTKVTISDDDVKNFYYNHYAESSPAARAYHIQAIVITPSNYKSPAAARKVADAALKEIQSGESFEEVAKRVSDDSTASSGGDLGTLTEDQMSPLIRDNLKSLKIGDVSPVLGNTKSGLLILKLVDVRSEEGDRMKKLKEEIRGQLIAAEYQHQVQLWLQRQRQTAFIHLAGESPTAGLPGEQQAAH